MGTVDDFPSQNLAQPIQDEAEAAFEGALRGDSMFALQSKDRSDYGSDYQIELIDRGGRTNFRIHVQLKGTTDRANVDGTISVGGIPRTNLNYLLASPDSIYVCYSLESKRLFARRAEDVYALYENTHAKWKGQASVTIRFSELFDGDFRRRMHGIVLARSRGSRNRRLDWASTPPEHLGAKVVRAKAPIVVPTVATDSFGLLQGLYSAGEDELISSAFDQFFSVLGETVKALDLLYMAEINLGLNDMPCDRTRIQVAVEHFEKRRGGAPLITPASIEYALGNAHLALGEHVKAVAYFKAAIRMLGEPDSGALAAQIWKNFGSALENSGDFDGAKDAFEQALNLDPDLAEAHLALGLWYSRHTNDTNRAIQYMDLIAKVSGSALSMMAVTAWRAKLLFMLDRSSEAFVAVNLVIGAEHLGDWEWSWCANLVREYGRGSTSDVKKSLAFWRKFLKEHVDDRRARVEEFSCYWQLQQSGEKVGLSFEKFVTMATTIMTYEGVDVAYLWDRVGHWAQMDGNWAEAESAYRRAFELDHVRYGCCLGTALNHTGKFVDALNALGPLTTCAEIDAVVWFQIAFARERCNDALGAVDAYWNAIDLDPDYAVAHFNLGGVLWNQGCHDLAIEVWGRAIIRFPEHESASKLRRDWPALFGAEPTDAP